MRAQRTGKPIAGYGALASILKWNADGLMPTVIQDATTRDVLTLCYLNPKALQRSLATGLVHVYRRSQQRVMLKGETSGHIQVIRAVRVDCEGKSLVLEVRQRVAACHTGYGTCYYRQLNARGALAAKGRRVFDPSTVYRQA